MQQHDGTAAVLNCRRTQCSDAPAEHVPQIQRLELGTCKQWGSLQEGREHTHTQHVMAAWLLLRHGRLLYLLIFYPVCSVCSSYRRSHLSLSALSRPPPVSLSVHPSLSLFVCCVCVCVLFSFPRAALSAQECEILGRTRAEPSPVLGRPGEPVRDDGPAGGDSRQA